MSVGVRVSVNECLSYPPDGAIPDLELSREPRDSLYDISGLVSGFVEYNAGSTSISVKQRKVQRHIVDLVTIIVVLLRPKQVITYINVSRSEFHVLPFTNVLTFGKKRQHVLPGTSAYRRNHNFYPSI